MSRVLITGSSDGLGLMAGRLLGGPGAPGDLSLGSVTQAWLAVSQDPAAMVSGGYFYHQRPRPADPAARDRAVQDRLLGYCAELTSVELAGAELRP